jgi:hypothetical protein
MNCVKSEIFQVHPFNTTRVNFVCASCSLVQKAHRNFCAMQHNLLCFLCSDECSDVAMDGDIPCL